MQANSTEIISPEFQFVKQKEKIFSTNVEFLQILKERFRQISIFLQMDLARAALVLIRVLRTLINSIAKNLHKL